MTQLDDPATVTPESALIALEPTPITVHPGAFVRPEKGSLFLLLLRTTDHKVIGRMYMVTAFVFFMLGGVMALLMRAELARPGMQFLSPEHRPRFNS